MVNEAAVVELYGNNGDGRVVRRTVASNAAISYGTLLQLTDENTVQLQAATASVAFGGIAAEEKVNNDYADTIAVYTDGVFDIVASGAINLGSPVTLNAQGGAFNYVSQAASVGGLGPVSGAAIVGISQATGSTNETIRIRINI